MKNLFCLVLLVGMLAGCGPVVVMPGSVPDASGGEDAAAYRLGAGDIVEVMVWRDAELSRTAMVAPDGTVSLPLVGKLTAANRTLTELKTNLEQRLAVYVPDPVISLDVKQTNSMQVYVIGKVNNPGRFLITENISVLQALAMAGGPTPFADRDDIRILREQTEGPTQSIPFDYGKVQRGKRLEQNIPLQRGDVIVVP